MISAALGAVACTFIFRLSKWYVENYCQDNPEIFWIWLDDDEPSGGHRIKTKQLKENRISFRGSNLSVYPV